MHNADWNSLQMTDKVRDILRAYQKMAPDHMGTYFVSSYQIALSLDEETRQTIDKPIGGAGTGESGSLPNYIATQLSQRISRGEITDIEGAWLADKHIAAIQFKDGERTFSAAGGTPGLVILSMFRLRPE